MDALQRIRENDTIKCVWTRQKKPGLKFSPRVFFFFLREKLGTLNTDLATSPNEDEAPSLSYWPDLLSTKAKVILLHLGQAMGKWLMLFSLHWVHLCTDHECSAGFQIWRLVLSARKNTENWLRRSNRIFSAMDKLNFVLSGVLSVNKDNLALRELFLFTF